MSIYSDKLAHVQAIINCQYSIGQMCTREDKLAHNLGMPRIDDVMSYNSLTTGSRKEKEPLIFFSKDCTVGILILDKFGIRLV